MSIIETNVPKVSEVKQKSLFEEALSKLDLQATLTLLTVLSERALFLHSKALLESNKIIKPKKLITS